MFFGKYSENIANIVSGLLIKYFNMICTHLVFCNDLKTETHLTPAQMNDVITKKYYSVVTGC